MLLGEHKHLPSLQQPGVEVQVFSSKLKLSFKPNTISYIPLEENTLDKINVVGTRSLKAQLV